jgi:4-amino-4-deoxy-L-arabinose transferase-like glycosyltransferase
VKEHRLLWTAVIIFFAALAFLAWGSQLLPVTDPVESNYALTAKEMVLSGDWLSPQIYGHYWYDKPIMVYWMLAASYSLMGFTELASRFPSVLTGALSAVVLYLYMQRITKNYKIAVGSAVFLATSLEFWVISHAIITDQILFLFTIPTMLSAYLGLIENNKKHMVIAYGASALACLTKGPVGLVLPGLLLLLWCLTMRSWEMVKRCFPWQGILCFIVIAVPWYAAMVYVHGSDFLLNFFGIHNIVRATSSEHPRDNVWYYYLALFPLAILPWTGLSIRAMFVGWKAKMPFYRFLMTWCWGTILFYTIMATKYVTYTYISVIPCIILAALLVPEVLENRKTALWLIGIPVWLLTAALTAGSFYLKADTWLPLYVMGILTFLGTAYALFRGHGKTMARTAAAGTAALYLCVISLGLGTYMSSRSAVDMYVTFHNFKGEHLFFKSYSASYTYYSGETAIRLVPSGLSEETRNPLWDHKYTMPSAGDNALAMQDPTVPVYLYVARGDRKYFAEWSMKDAFSPVVTFPSGTIYKLVNTNELLS